MEWDYSGRKGRDGQKKKIGKANKRKGKVKRAKDEELNGQGERGAPAPRGGIRHHHSITVNISADYVTCILFLSCYDAGCVSGLAVSLQSHVQPKQELGILQNRSTFSSV